MDFRKLPYFTKKVKVQQSLFTTFSPNQKYMIYVRAVIYQSILLNERNIYSYPYLKYWVYDNIYLNLLTSKNMKGSVIITYEKNIETTD